MGMGLARDSESLFIEATLTSVFRLCCNLRTGGGRPRGVLLGLWAGGHICAHSLVVDAPAGGRCSSDGIGLEGPRSPAAREAQGIAAHGSPEDQPSATATSGIHHSWGRGEEGSIGIAIHRDAIPSLHPHPPATAASLPNPSTGQPKENL